MQRTTITLDDELMAAIDRHMAARGLQNRSEAIRDLTRAGLDAIAGEGDDRSSGVAAVMYVYDHHKRELPKRLTAAFHDHHEMSLAALHVHLDPDNCLEVSVLRGRLADVRLIGERIIAERGVRHGRVVTLVSGAVEAPHRHRHR